jgi:hypothetical protein
MCPCLAFNIPIHWLGRPIHPQPYSGQLKSESERQALLFGGVRKIAITIVHLTLSSRVGTHRCCAVSADALVNTLALNAPDNNLQMQHL